MEEIVPSTHEILVQPTTEEIESSAESVSLREQLIGSGISEYFVSQLQNIVYYTSKVGLSLEDACKLADFDYEEFKAIVDSNRLVRGILEKKELEYKKDLLHTLSAKARSGDDKLAQWLLERRFPEFSTKNKGQGNDEDLLGMAISFIQKSGNSTPLVSETSGKAFIIRKTGDGKTWKEKLQGILK